MNTVSNKFFIVLIFGVLLWGGGCSLLSLQEEKSLAFLQKAVRERMLKLQSSELLAAAAREKYTPRKAVELLELATGYQENIWRVDNDPALQVLEEAIAYGLIVSSKTPEKTAAELTAAFLDYGTAVRLLRLREEKNPSAGGSASELAMMTNWNIEEVRRCKMIPLPSVSVKLFPLYPDAEQLLNTGGGAAAFQCAAELYRDPSNAMLLKCERLRRAMLNRVLMQAKSPGAQMTPELYTAFWRGKLFSSFLPRLRDF